jgi:rhodanese-related sulfurtransferase
MFSFLKNLFTNESATALQNINIKNAFLVDVRTPQEFAQAAVKGSVNIPLDKVQSQLATFKNKDHIIVFCRSGNRSSQAKNILTQNGFTNVINGGTWQNVNQLIK